MLASELLLSLATHRVVRVRSAGASSYSRLTRLTSPIRTLTVGSLPGDPPPADEAVVGSRVVGWRSGLIGRPADHRSGISPNPEERRFQIASARITHTIFRPVLTILLTRHGHTDRSEPEQYLGQHVDAQLSARGRAAAERLRDRLAGVRLDRILASTLDRAAETARIVAGERPVELDRRLMELDYGRWEGLTLDAIEERFPGEYERYEENPATFRVGGGENGTIVARRLGAVISGLLDWAESSGGDKTCLVVGHSSTNRVLLALTLGVPLRDYRRRFDQDWANLTVLDWKDRDQGPLLRLANDVSHLHGVHGVTWG